MAAHRDLVRWYWPHVWALDQILQGLPTARIQAPPAPRSTRSPVGQQLELARRLKAATWMSRQ